MNFGDKKTLLIAGGIAAVAVIVLLAVLLLGGKKQPAETPTPTSPEAKTTAASSTAGPNAAAPTPGQPGTPTPTGAPGAPGAAQAGAPGAPAAPAAKGVPWASIRLGSGEMSALTRPDPLVYLQPPPMPIPPEQLIPIPTVNLQLGGLRPAGAEQAGVITTIANRRVAGVKFDGGAWAILESESDDFIVKPGDDVNGTKIISISRDAILITDPQGQPWIVPLRAAGPGPAATPVSTRRVSGLPNSPSEF